MTYHSAFWQAIELGNTAAVKTFLDERLNPNIIGPEEKRIQNTAIVRAAKLGHVDIVKLLAQHPSIQTTTVVDAYDAALATNNIALIQFFESNQFLSYRNLYDESLLHRAVHKQKIDSVIALLKLGIDPNHKDENESRPLAISCQICVADEKHPRGKSIGIVEALLEHGADPNPTEDDIRSRPLAICAQKSNLYTMDLILRYLNKDTDLSAYLKEIIHEEEQLCLVKLHGFKLNSPTSSASLSAAISALGRSYPIYGTATNQETELDSTVIIQP